MKVSIITVSFNSVKTIEETIQSVLSQDYPDIEYIVIDGGSTDGTLDILRAYDKQIHHWISEPDSGMYDAMNKGIQLATGDVIGILNSDDIYIGHHVVTELINALKLKQADLVFADLILVDQLQPKRVLRYYNSGQFKPSKFRWGWMPAHPTVFVRRAVYERVGPFATDYQIAADYEMLIRILAVHQTSYVYVPKAVVQMRSGGASTASLMRNWVLNKEIVRACKDNGIYSNMAMLLPKIPIKLWGALKGRLQH